jgi:DNA ligase-4
MANDTEMQDRGDRQQDDEAFEEEGMMYGRSDMARAELDEKYPTRPHIRHKTLPFHELYTTLFDPLTENKKKPTGPAIARKKTGPNVQAPNDVRRSIIERFISRWRELVGNDIFPAFRLIVPEKDRERGMYGLKEMTLGKMLVRVMKINKDSEDGHNLLHWKLPGVKSSSAMAGDFAGRCFEALSKRAMLTKPGKMTVAEVNEKLDQLAVAQKEENQLPIIEHFYTRMNATELMWLIRVILRQMKVGASEKTIFDVWHPDAENLFNISSNLRRVCWELYDPQVRLEGDNAGISLMQCFQPQLAAFQMRSMEHMVSRMKPTEDDAVFWIEEKLDGERMQLHMIEDDTVPGGKRFGFWSRKAKNYTYLYGEGFEDDNAALTRHIRDAFKPSVRNLILDGEMITWDFQQDALVPFGTLKTAALAEQANPFAGGHRPLFRVFDCLYLNDKDLTRYTLRNRREALTNSVETIHRRLEIHDYQEASQASEIDPMLRKVVAESTEGLVLKNPRSDYRLNERNDDWIKVKPEYMTEFGESLDCIVIGGYYGSGKRGGNLSSFICGLKLSQQQLALAPGTNPQKCWSFFKVGGGFAAGDYAAIRHQTEGKWIKWDARKPPTDWIGLGGGDRQFEKPDVWIKPDDSVVLSVKAAAATPSDQFATGLTLRFPRFKKLRLDKSFKEALSQDEFLELKRRAEGEQSEKKMKIDESRKQRTSKKPKRTLAIQGQEDEINTPYAGPVTKVFDGLTFFIMTEARKPNKKSKQELEQLVKANGGSVVASGQNPDTILIADHNAVKVASIKKHDNRNIIKPKWLLDCIKQGDLDVGRPALLLPLEPGHSFYIATADQGKHDGNVDPFGDSFAQDLTAESLRALLDNMPSKIEDVDSKDALDHLNEYDSNLDAMKGFMFHGLIAYFEDVPMSTIRLFEFAGGQIAKSVHDSSTHVVIGEHCSAADIRKGVSSRSKQPRIVKQSWVVQSWVEGTRLDEERKLLASILVSVHLS